MRAQTPLMAVYVVMCGLNWYCLIHSDRQQDEVVRAPKSFFTRFPLASDSSYTYPFLENFLAGLYVSSPFVLFITSL